MTLLDTTQAASYLNIARRTMERWRCEGYGPNFIRIGRVVRYSDSALEDWIQRQTRTSTSQEAA